MKIPHALAVSALLLGTTLAEPPTTPPKPPSEKAVPLKAKFQAYDGNSAEQAKMTFQINMIGGQGPTHFLSIGELISGTPYRLESFTAKTRKHPQTGEEEDVSELKLIHNVTKQTLVLPLGKPTELLAK